MKLVAQCLPCGLMQIIEAGRILDLPEPQVSRMLDRALVVLQERDESLPPPLLGRALHRVIRDELGVCDPYREQKRRATLQALELLPSVERYVRAATSPFRAAVRVSTAGNVLDLGIPGLSAMGPREVIEQAEHAWIDPNGVAELEEAVSKARSILFLADNAGELVLDRPLLSLMTHARVTVGVRGEPTINDATLEDALESGIASPIRLIDNGADIPGTWLPACKPSFVNEFKNADVVIAKGQGNYETLTEFDREVFMLLRVKCTAVARNLNQAVGNSALCHQRVTSAQPNPSGPE